MSAVQSVVWRLRCDRCGFTDYQAVKVSSARQWANEDGWTQIKPTAEAKSSRVDLCPECAAAWISRRRSHEGATDER